MYSDCLYRLLIIGTFVLMAGHSALAKSAKCVYWFGQCTSCEAPLTCENSRPSKEEAKSSPQSGNRSARPPAVASSVTRIAPLPSRPGKSSGLYEEYQQFKAFMQRNGGLEQVTDHAEMQRLFFSYKRWRSQQAAPGKD